MFTIAATGVISRMKKDTVLWDGIEHTVCKFTLRCKNDKDSDTTWLNFCTAWDNDARAMLDNKVDGDWISISGNAKIVRKQNPHEERGKMLEILDIRVNTVNYEMPRQQQTVAEADAATAAKFSEQIAKLEAIIAQQATDPPEVELAPAAAQHPEDALQHDLALTGSQQ